MREMIDGCDVRVACVVFRVGVGEMIGDCDAMCDVCRVGVQ